MLMRRNSPKRRAYNSEAAKVSVQLIHEVDHCEACGHGPRNRWPSKPMQVSVLTPHEIGRGQFRRDCQGKRFATLVLCWGCNSLEFTDAEKWPVAKQLCLLKHVRPQDYDRAAFVSLLKPNAPRWITEEDVAEHDAAIVSLLKNRRCNP